ncbi:metallopeptidase TldD-related protein [Brevundimonas sp. 2R-24]|uniref:Metallopeptidase TldD-related protein n=1 Tax=Peiella sedimenti TaxID=3061083 RepID=A0ABT8SJN5_9CAUL|nr:metallopeptidase TldD-related protein [Caulobacteraceae bacterium XZ-24]
MASSPNPDPAELLEDVVRAALKAGADAAEAVTAERRALSIGVRMGALEEVEREESRDLGLRVFIGKRQATVSSSDLSAETRERLVERAVAMAKLAPEDPWCGLADPDLLASGEAPDLDLFDADEPDAARLEARALEAEDAARAVEGVTNSEGGSASWSMGRWRLLTSDGFTGVYRGTVSSTSASVIAERDGVMERGGEGRAARYGSDLPSPALLGRDAGERAVQRLGARKLSSRTAPVIFENRIAASLLSPIIGAVSGPAVTRGVSFLKGKLGQRILPEGMDLIEEPFRPRGLGSTPFDDEGVRVQERKLVDDGVLTTWLLNTSSAAQLGLRSTGHASRGLAGPAGVSTHNLHLKPGERTLAQLVADAGSGLLVTSMFGPSLNPDNGDWSTGVSGFWFEDGEIVHPVNEVTVAGSIPDLLMRLVAGSDLEFRGSTNAPSLLIDGVAIAGA